METSSEELGLRQGHLTGQEQGTSKNHGLYGDIEFDIEFHLWRDWLWAPGLTSFHSYRHCLKELGNVWNLEPTVFQSLNKDHLGTK